MPDCDDDLLGEKGYRITSRDVPELVREIQEIDVESVLVDLKNQTIRIEMRKKDDVPYWFPIAGVVFTALTILTLFLALTGVVPIDPGKRVLFNVWVAFCLAASVGFLTGSASASGKIPLPSALGDSPIAFSAVGGVAVFLVILLVMTAIN